MKNNSSSRILNFFGLTDPTPRAETLAKTMYTMMPLAAFTLQLSSTFFMINLAEIIGGGSYISGIPLIGLLIVLQMTIQIVLDYPTGAIGDWIGQRYIVTSAFLCFACAFVFMSAINATNIILVAVLVYVMMGIGHSQLSGAFSAWFDNNYRVAMPEDTERRQYGVFMGKINMLFSLIGTLALIPGSIMAVILGRAAVFQLQAILCVLVAASSLKVLNDFPEVSANREQRPSMKQYSKILHDGISYIFASRYLKYILLGTTLATSVQIIWGELLLFPMYFSYLGSEVPVSSYRTVLFIIFVITAERASAFSRRMDAEKWLTHSALLGGSGFVFYMAFALIMYLLPPTSDGYVIITLPLLGLEIGRVYSASVLPVVLILVVFTLTGGFGILFGIFLQRLVIDVIPNRIRNSTYSLSPTLTTIITIPQIALFGWMIPNMGFPLTMAICGLIALAGVIMIRIGLASPRPVLTEDLSEIRLKQKDTVIITQSSTSASDGDQCT